MTSALLRFAQRFSLLGSTGSIGTQTLDIVREQPEKFEIVALAAGGNLSLLADQARRECTSLAVVAALYFGDNGPKIFGKYAQSLGSDLEADMLNERQNAHSGGRAVTLSLHTVRSIVWSQLRFLSSAGGQCAHR